MKILIALIVIVPTLIAALLFTVASLAYNNPTALAATVNPAIAILCTVAGVITALPITVTAVVGLGRCFVTNKTKNKDKNKDKENK